MSGLQIFVNGCASRHPERPDLLRLKTALFRVIVDGTFCKASISCRILQRNKLANRQWVVRGLRVVRLVGHTPNIELVAIR